MSGATAIARAVSPGTPGSTLWLLTALTLMSAAAAVYLNRAKKTDEANKWVRSNAAQTRGSGRFPTMADLRVDGYSHSPDPRYRIPYQQRDLELELNTALSTGAPVVVVGTAMAGKTTLLVQALRSRFPSRPVWVPKTNESAGTVEVDGTLPGAIVLLDDLDRYLSSKTPFNGAGLESLLRSNCLVVATMRSEERAKIFAVGEVVTPERQLLNRFTEVNLVSDQVEQDRLAQALPQEARAYVSRYGFGPFLGGGYRAVQYYDDKASTPQQRGDALIRAATAWRLIGFPDIDDETLKAIHEGFLSQFTGRYPTEDFTEALAWATKSIDGRLQLLEPAGSGTRRVFDYLYDHLVQGDMPVPDYLWETALAALATNPSHAFDVGVRAHKLGHPEHARSAWTIDADQARHALPSVFNLGVLALDDGDVAKAIPFFRQVMDTDHFLSTAARYNFGIAELRKDDPDAARRALQQVVATGDPDFASRALVDLGAIEMDHDGDLDVARAFLQEAAATNHVAQGPRALISLGMLEGNGGNYEAARSAFERAEETGHPGYVSEARFNLGALNLMAEKVEAARSCWEQVVLMGDAEYVPRAWFNLGGLAQLGRDAAAARAAYERVVETGHVDHTPEALFTLGVMEQQFGNTSRAREALQRAADSQHHEHAPHALLVLGYLEEMEGDLGAARAAWQMALDSGHPEHGPQAMYNLARLNAGVL